MSEKPYIAIFKGDCFEILPTLNRQFDLIFTDPPYSCQWKEQIVLHNRKPFYWNYEELKKFDDVDIRAVYQKLYPEFDRLLKKSGSVLIFVRNEYVSYAVEEGLKNNLQNKSCFYWIKTNPVPQVRKKNYLSAVETILWQTRYDKKCLFTFNFKTQKEMVNYMFVPICGGKERTIHPTQKPLKLLIHLLEIHSNEGDWVLDPFGGVFSIGVACCLLNRNYVGVEINEKYYSIGKERLTKELVKLKNKILGGGL